jgi:hypothetical protein
MELPSEHLGKDGRLLLHRYRAAQSDCLVLGHQKP